jgi:hypothetical protein
METLRPLNVAALQNLGILIVGADLLNISEVNGVLEYIHVNHRLHISKYRSPNRRIVSRFKQCSNPLRECAS